MKNFYKELRIMRKDKGFTLKELSKRTGKQISYLSDLERGCRPIPNIKVVKVLEKALEAEDKSLQDLIVDCKTAKPLLYKLFKCADRDITLNELMVLLSELNCEDESIIEDPIKGAFKNAQL